MKTNNLLYALYFILICYLLAGTPLVSDDFALMVNHANAKTLAIPEGMFIVAPIEHYLYNIGYHFFNLEGVFLVNLLKVFFIFLSFYLTTKFFSIYLNRQCACWAAFLFIFFPSHDAAAFWYLGTYLPLVISFYMYAFYLAYHNRLFWAFIVALVASFTSYASVAIVVLFIAIFALTKKFKKGLVIFIPNIIYCCYYFYIAGHLDVARSQIPEAIALSAIIKQFFLQVLTFADSVIGPSMWLKIYYSFFQLSPVSIIIGVMLVVGFYKTYQKGNRRYDRRLVISLSAMALFSFLIYALTGRYPQLAFNLGNRVTIFGSLLLVYLIILMPLSRRLKTFVFALMIFTILGISDHWKGWHLQQSRVITNIKNNQDLKNYRDSRGIYVSGNQYSKYGPLSHIEFFSESWVTSPVFTLLFRDGPHAYTLNRRHKYIDGYLVDTKYDEKRKVNDYINVYDSERDRFFKLNADEINNYIASLDPDNRHWVQIANIKFLEDMAIRLMPRLKYTTNNSL